VVLGDTTFVAAIGGRTQPGLGAEVNAGAVVEGWRVLGLKYSMGVP
jgi:hypothetical protein